MRPMFRTVLVALVATLALSAVASASASAAECSSREGGDTCLVIENGPEVEGRQVGITGTGGTVTFVVPGWGGMECKQSESTGAIDTTIDSSLHFSNIVITYKGCVLL